MQESFKEFSDPHLPSLDDCRATRRSWLTAALASAGFMCYPPVVRAIDLNIANDSSPLTKVTRIKSVLEVKGSVKLKNYRSKIAGDQRSASIEAKSTLEYEEEYRNGPPEAGIEKDAAYQIYHQAELDNLIEKHATKLVLRESCRELVRKSVSDRMTTVCIDHPLTIAERDLVESPLSTMYLEQLFPSREIELGDSWQLDAEVAAKLLNLDTVTKGIIKVTLIEADDQIGQLALKGTLEGQVRNIETKIELEGKAKIDRKEGIISWVALSFEEDREVSEYEPGFNIQARLRILRERIERPSSGKTLVEMEERLDGSNSAELAQFDSKLGAYTFVADRNWTTYNDSGVDATLRWIQKNRVVAQCTITNMTDMEPGRQLSIEGYQNDIQKALGKRFGQFLEADERLSQTGLRMMRIVTIGQVEGVPVQWIHILLSNDAGRHLALAYSMNASSVEAFGTNDLQMAGSLELTLRQLPVAPDESKSDENPKAGETKSASKSVLVPPKR